MFNYRLSFWSGSSSSFSPTSLAYLWCKNGRTHVHFHRQDGGAPGRLCRSRGHYQPKGRRPPTPRSKEAGGGGGGGDDESFWCSLPLTVPTLTGFPAFLFSSWARGASRGEMGEYLKWGLLYTCHTSQPFPGLGWGIIGWSKKTTLTTPSRCSYDPLTCYILATPRNLCPLFILRIKVAKTQHR